MTKDAINRAQKIVFISHDAARAGAQLLLLTFLRWLKANIDIPFEIILRESGELESEFASLGPVFRLDGASKGRRILTRALRSWAPGQPQRCHHCGEGRPRKRPSASALSALQHRLARDNVGLIYSNTVMNGDVLSYVSQLGRPIISHVHELEYAIRYNGEGDNFQQVKNSTTHFVAVSQAVKDNLIGNHGIEVDRIDVVHGFIPTRRLQVGGLQAGSVRIRDRLQLPPDAQLVGAVGNADWWKGPDLFIQVARAVRDRNPGAYFVWVGADNDGQQLAGLSHDIVASGLGDRIRLLPRCRNVEDYFAAFDIFVLVSRTDSFPLVVLEAASYGTPIVCFDAAGGAREFVEEDAGFVVPYLDIPTMAARVSALLDDAELRARLGRRAADKVRTQHGVSRGAAKLFGIIERFLMPAGQPSMAGARNSR